MPRGGLAQCASAGLDRGEQLAAVAFAVLGDEGFGLGVGEIGDALLGAKMKFNPDALVRRVDHREGVAAEAMRMAEAFRDAAVRHRDGDLVQRLAAASRNPSCCPHCAARYAGRA